MSLRDTVPLVIHVDGDTIKASRGLGELYDVPAVTFKARYGLRRSSTTDPTSSTSTSSFALNSSSPARHLSEYLIAQSLEDVIAKEGEDALDIRWPFDSYDEDGHTDGRAAGKGNRLAVDWKGREAILYHVFFTAYQLQPSTNLSTLLLIPPACDILSPSTLSTYTQLAFETLNVPALHILDPSLAALYGTNAISGLAVMIGRKETVCDVVWEGVVREDARVVVDVGKEDCMLHLVELLSRDSSVREQIDRFEEEERGENADHSPRRQSRAIKELAESILEHAQLREGKVVNVPLAGGGAAAIAAADEEEEEGVFNVAKVLVQNDASKSIQQLKDSKSKKSAAQQAIDAAKSTAATVAAQQLARAEAAADIYAFEVPSLNGRKVRVGPVRHRACEPLYRDSSTIRKGKQGRTVQEGMAVAVGRLEKEYRQQLWESVVFTGEMTKIPSLQFAIASYLTSFMVTSPDRETDYQYARALLRKMPEYYVNFRGVATDLAPFLGGCITAKIAFTDGRDQNCITKYTYNLHGPAASHLATAME